MEHPKTASRAEWLIARKDLLAVEKETTRQHDALASARRSLPIVVVEKPYLFDGPDGTVSLRDLFRGRSQIIVYHFMFDPAWDGRHRPAVRRRDGRIQAWIRHHDRYPETERSAR